MPRKPNTAKVGYNDPFPTALRKLMNERRVTQDTIAQVLGLKNRQSVTGYVDGSTMPTTDKVVALAKFFSVSADFLLGLTDIETPDIGLVCEYLQLSEEAVRHVANKLDEDSFGQKALKGLDILLRSKSLPELCEAIHSNVMYQTAEENEEYAYKITELVSTLPDIEAKLSEQYGTAIRISFGDEAIEEMNSELKRCAESVFDDIFVRYDIHGGKP